MSTHPLPRTGHARVRGRQAAAVLFALALAAPPLLAQRQAQPRSGSSGGDGAPAARHAPSGSSRGPSGGSSASQPASSPSRSSAARSAVRRDTSSRAPSPHRDPGEARRRHGSGRFFYPYYPYSRFGFGLGYYSPYYYPYYYGYPHYYGYPSYGRWGYHMPYGYPAEGVASYGRRDRGAVALKVRPKTAEVYADGRYLGTAGSFDGFPSYLWLEPGVYTLELVRDGYSNLEREIEVLPGEVLEFKLRLDRGVSRRPEIGRDEYDRSAREPYPRRGPGDWDRRERDPVRDRARELPQDVRRQPAGLVFDVRPDDASVYLDGRFIGTGSEVSSSRSPFVVDPGEHVLQVVHPDYETEQRELSVRSGEEMLVEITLRGDRI